MIWSNIVPIVERGTPFILIPSVVASMLISNCSQEFHSQKRDEDTYHDLVLAVLFIFLGAGKPEGSN